MKKLAEEYRLAAAKIAMKISEHKKKGDLSEYDLNLMTQMLRDARETARLLSGYYEIPRSGEFDSSSWSAGQRRRDDG